MTAVIPEDWAAAEKTAVLTDTSGDNYVYLGSHVNDGTTVGDNLVKTTTATEAEKIAEVPVTLKVEYTAASGESLPSASEIANIWKDTIGSNTVSIQGTGSANVRFLSKGSGLAAADWAGTAGDATIPASVTVTNASLIALTFNASGVSTTNAPASDNFHVALTGQTAVETSSTQYTITLTPVNPS